MTLTLRNFCTVACVALAAGGAASGQAVSSADSLNSVQSVEIREQPAPSHVSPVREVKPIVKAAATRKPVAAKSQPASQSRPRTISRTEPRKATTPRVTAAVAPKPAPAPTPRPTVAVQEQTPVKLSLPRQEEPSVDRVVEFAQARAEESAKPQTSPVKTGFSVILKLAVVLLLAYVSILALKLLSKRQESSPRLRKDLRVMDTVKLSQTSSLHVVDFNGKKMLVGCSAGQVNLLREFDQEEQHETEAPSEGRFAEYLAKYAGSSFEKTPGGRMAGMLRDCAAHLRSRRGSAGSGETLVNKNDA